MAATCKLCSEKLAADDDTIECGLCNEVEHITCHSDRGHEWELIAAPGRATLARHSAECIELTLSELPTACGDDQAARDLAWQTLEDGRYICICGELERGGRLIDSPGH